MFITRGNQAVSVVAHDLEYKSFLTALNDVQSNDFIIDLYPVDRDPLWCLFVGRFQIYLPFVSIVTGRNIASMIIAHCFEPVGTVYANERGKVKGSTNSCVSIGNIQKRGVQLDETLSTEHPSAGLVKANRAN